MSHPAATLPQGLQPPPGLFSHLLLDVLVVRVEQLDEDGHGSSLDYHLGVQEGPRGNVGQGPGCLKLKRRTGGEKGGGREKERSF